MWWREALALILGTAIMNLTFRHRVVGLTLTIACAGNVHAGALAETCGLVYKNLSSGPYESLTKSMENFADQGKHYYGCVIRLSGNANEVTDTQRPDGLFGFSLPDCTGGKISADPLRDLLDEDGWCGDNGADGPDGTSYQARTKNVLCAVEGRWDGGDDSEPEYVPSPRYEVIVKCANRRDK